MTDHVLAKCEFANVSEIVTSHAMHLPLPQGIKVIPSGRLLSSFNNRFLSAWDFGTQERASDNVIDGIVASYAACATSACWTMTTSLVNSSPTNACIWVTKTYPQSKAHCYSNGLVIQTKATSSDWPRIQPVSTMWCLSGQQTGSTIVIRESSVQNRQSTVDGELI